MDPALDKNGLLAADSFEGRTFSRLQLAGTRVRGKTFDGCTFQGCDLSESVLERCVFADCVLEDCDLSSARVLGCGLRGVVFRASKLIGVTWEDVSPFELELRFEDSDLSLSSFWKTTLVGVQFVGCRALEVGFEEADLSRAAFPRTRLDGSQFQRCTLRDTDLSEAEGYLVVPGENELGDTLFSLRGARDLLQHLGIRLPDLGSPGR